MAIAVLLLLLSRRDNRLRVRRSNLARATTAATTTISLAPARTSPTLERVIYVMASAT